jgi:hypothetical protein
MASIITASIDVTKIPKDKLVDGKKGKYLNIDIIINDESKFGNNTAVTVRQSKEERDAEQPKTYLGNGRVVWTDGKVSLAESDEEPKSNPADDLYGDAGF